MREIETPVQEIRRKIFAAISKVAFESTKDTFNDEIEAIPYELVGEVPKYRESVYRERAIMSEYVRLAMGMSLRPENKAVHITHGMENSNIDEKYYEPPLMQVIPSACNACESNKYIVSDICKGCVAHPCRQVCPKGAIDVIDGKSVINQEKCVKCGKCKDICPYDAIAKLERPCERACGVKAFQTDEHGRACIDNEKCLSCGMCMVSCPFGAISDKSQVFQLSRALREGKQIEVALAPAFVGQFGTDVTPKKFKQALLKLGFKGVHEVALGADIGAVAEAKQYAERVITGEIPFLLTSCCPSWAMLAKSQFPDLIDSVSNELTPMVATARSIKKKNPNVQVVFIGPCAAKKLEASRTDVRSDVDFVITFEELWGMFDAKNIVPSEMEEDTSFHDATAAGRGYAVSGGVATAIQECMKEYYPKTPIKIEHAEGLAECKKVLMLAKAGKMNGCLIEGMGCPGGCMGGAGTNISLKKAQMELKKYKAKSTKQIPPYDVIEIELD